MILKPQSPEKVQAFFEIQALNEIENGTAIEVLFEIKLKNLKKKKERSSLL